MTNHANAARLHQIAANLCAIAGQKVTICYTTGDHQLNDDARLSNEIATRATIEAVAASCAAWDGQQDSPSAKAFSAAQKSESACSYESAAKHHAKAARIHARLN